jgi:hypothetical protein
VLEEDPDNEKAHYRRGQALTKTGDHEGALEAFETVKRIRGAGDVSIAGAIAACEKRAKEGREKNKEMYKKMFASRN